MKWLDIDRIKAQLRLDDLQAQEEHCLLETYGEAAEETVLNACNRTTEDLVENYGNIPTSLMQAALMVVASLYQNREKDGSMQYHPNPTFDMLVKPYLKLTT